MTIFHEISIPLSEFASIIVKKDNIFFKKIEIKGIDSFENFLFLENKFYEDYVYFKKNYPEI